MNDLVNRLSDKNNKISFSRPEKTAQALNDRIGLGYVYITFENTGTELGLKLFMDECEFGTGDFDKGEGEVTLVGGITLNFEKVKCTARIDLKTLEGVGYLEGVTDDEYERIMAGLPVV